jgi:hypothetical protein
MSQPIVSQPNLGPPTLRPTSATVEAAIQQLFQQKRGQAPLSEEIEHISKILHDAPSYHEMLHAAYRTAALSPDHEGCIFVQIGFFLGLHAARKLVQ